MGTTDNNMQPYKVQSCHGKRRRVGVVANSLKDLLKKACQKLSVRSLHYRPSHNNQGHAKSLLSDHIS